MPNTDPGLVRTGYTMTNPATSVTIRLDSTTDNIRYSQHIPCQISLATSAHMARHTQLLRDQYTTPTTAASVSGRSLGQRRQGRNIFVHHARVDTLPILIAESRSSYLTLPFIIFLPHPTTLAPRMLVI